MPKYSSNSFLAQSGTEFYDNHQIFHIPPPQSLVLFHLCNYHLKCLSNHFLQLLSAFYPAVAQPAFSSVHPLCL